MNVSNEHQWLSGSPNGILNKDTLLEVKCPVPVPNKQATLEEFIAGDKYDVVKNSEGQYILKVKGSRGY